MGRLVLLLFTEFLLDSGKDLKIYKRRMIKDSRMFYDPDVITLFIRVNDETT